MKRYRVMVQKFGFTTISAKTEKDALEKVDSMSNSDFDWSEDWSKDDATIIDELSDTDE